jgi:hypothetical protein
MTKVSIKHERSAIVAMYGRCAHGGRDNRSVHRPRNRQRAGRPHPGRLSHVYPGAHRHRRHDLPGLRVHHRSARRRLLVLDNPGRERREAVGPRRRDQTNKAASGPAGTSTAQRGRGATPRWRGQPGRRGGSLDSSTASEEAARHASGRLSTWSTPGRARARPAAVGLPAHAVRRRASSSFTSFTSITT